MRTYSAACHQLWEWHWRAKSAIYLSQHPVERRLLRANADLQNQHAGERCFILGNGPSLVREDLSLLVGETLFTVNNLRASEVGAPRPRYHVISDRRFLSVDPANPTDQAVYEPLRAIITGEDDREGRVPTTFLPSSEWRFQSHFSADAHDIRYFCNPFYFSDYYALGFRLSGVIPRFSSVVQHAIVVAIAMGFKAIYLLGCDGTNIIANIETSLSESTDSRYAYRVSAELDKWHREQFAKRDMERCAESFVEVLIGFRFLGAYARSKGIELVNCSSRTVVDSLPRAPLQLVI